MTERSIRIRGARANNLRSVDVDIPRNRLVVFVGVSGSGKSSLVFDTVAAEAGHQINETFPPFTRNRLPKWSRPPADLLEGLSAVVVIDQKRLGGNVRSTVGTITDTWAYLRLLFSRLSEPYVGESNHFSFNDPAGMCPTCSGIGEVVTSDVEQILDLDKSLSQGAIRVPGFGPGGYWYGLYADIGEFDETTPLRDWTPGQREALLYGGQRAAQLGGKPAQAYEGVVTRFERLYLHTADELSDHKREAIRRFTRSQSCPDCSGDRLNPASRRATVHGHTLPELARREVTELVEIVRGIDAPEVAPVVEALVARLEAMVTIGLGYLNLGRPTTTLSGGESQRVKTVKHLGSSLVEMIYVFDEPTVGLHPHDVGSMIALLQRLRAKGNSILVVEHDPDVMAQADHIIEIGPDAGAEGGRVTFQGTYDELRRAGTATGLALDQRLPLNTEPRQSASSITVRDATRNNLQHLTVDIPLGVLTVLTGVAGSGKSSLAAELVAQHAAVVVDQRPVAASRRSTPITYTGIADPIRKLFASRNNVGSALFSANSEGGCPDCDGLGVHYTDLAFLEGQETVCETCRGARFRAEVLAYTVDGLSIADVDALTVAEALQRLSTPAITRRLRHLEAVGLGYLRLGQTLTTLSGGEAQRVKIAKELRDTDRPTLYVLDEPTTGLHPRDITTLLGVIDALIEHGHSVVVIEHNLDVIRRADWVIDLGPGPGRHGGRILYQGPVAGMTGTLTARALTGSSRVPRLNAGRHASDENDPSLR